MNTSEHILSLADRCVKCGLCLPQCPTYALTENENESPRGRIALIQGWLSGQLAPSETLTQHLDQCLLCRRCERVCPSVVPFGAIMDQSKALLTKEVKPRFSLSSLIMNNSLKLMLSKTISGYFFSILRLLQKTGIFILAAKSGLLKKTGLQRVLSYLPTLDKPFKSKSFYPVSSINHEQQVKGNVALFTGCLSKQLDPETVNASIKLLNYLGYGVYVPEQQECCGALHLHDGNTQQAVTFANKNITTFNQQDNITSVISLVNGCTSQLREYSKLTTENFNSEVKDIIEFLAELDWPENVTIKPLNKKVTVQIPCSLQNTLRADDKLLSLINRIPALTIENVFNRCCGAAGSYFLRHPQISDQLQQQAATQLRQTSPDYIISSNLGCALQLKAGLCKGGDAPQIIHPVVLIAQQLNLN